jgi:hypothetical protein
VTYRRQWGRIGKGSLLDEGLRRRSRISRVVFLVGVSVAALALGRGVAAAADVAVYGETLAAGWQDWSWGGVTRDFNRTSPVYAGSRSIGVTFTGGWSGLQLGRNDRLDLSGQDILRFRVHGGSSGGQQLEVRVGNNQSGAYVSRSFTPSANAWTLVEVPLWELGTPRQADYLYWFNATAGAQSTFSLDDIVFAASGAPTPTAIPAGAGPALRLDATAVLRPISPYIYGMNFAPEDLAAEVALPLNRWGGNATTRYNWRNDTSNRASDWYFENIPNDNANPGALPNGSASDQFVEQNRRTGTETIITLPLIGWTPKSRGYTCGFSVAKYGAQQSTDSWRPDCGNGIRSNGTAITGNDPLDTSEAITPVFVQDWITHLTTRYGDAGEGGVRFYNLDNEPELWDGTHRDVHPQPTSYDEMRDRGLAYAAAVKAVDPLGQTLGPVGWGWSAYFWSALDWAPGGDWWNHPQDRQAHGNVPFVAWYLQQMRAYDQQHGVRLLDYFDLHYYPQAAGVTLSTAGGAATQALRLRSTRSLWDSSYTDESWIAEPVRLIPRMREWVDANYPGTRLAITEYNWGGLEHINGAVAQADVLGIFGREGLDLATLWDPPTSSEPVAYAFRLYLDYDGAGGRFGDVALSASSDDQEKLSVYAARRQADGAITAMVINKSVGPLVSRLVLDHLGAAGSAAVYRYSSAKLDGIVREADAPIAAGGIDATFPGSSITLFVVAAGSGTPLPSGTATPTATATPTRPTATGTATHVPAPSTSTRTSTAVPATATATAVPPTGTSTRVPSTQTPTRSATRTRTPSVTRSATRTRTPTRQATSTRTRTRTSTRPVATLTRTRTATRTATRTRTPTRTRTATRTRTPTRTP